MEAEDKLVDSDDFQLDRRGGRVAAGVSYSSYNNDLCKSAENTDFIIV